MVKPPWINNGKPLPGSVNSAWQDPGWLQDGGDQPLFGTNLREGSYTVNDYLLAASRFTRWPAWQGGGLPANVFKVEDQVSKPTLTPVLGDGVLAQAMAHENDPPPANFGGRYTIGLGAGVVPRHGSPQTNPQTPRPMEASLPGAINIVFFDGHAEKVKLESLWRLNWHANYVAPLKRPGLR